MTNAKIEDTLQKYSEKGEIAKRKHMRRKNHAFSSFTKHLAKSVKFDGYVSRETRDAALDLIPEGAPFWKYYPQKAAPVVAPTIRQVKISDLPIKRTFDSVIDQGHRLE